MQIGGNPMNCPQHRLANIKDDGWELEDGEELHRENPDLFWIPSNNIRNNLLQGMIVKLIFKIKTIDEDAKEEDNFERMWVIVKEKINGYYIGELDNDPRCTDEIKAGLKVVFEPRHVVQIYEES